MGFGRALLRAILIGSTSHCVLMAVAQAQTSSLPPVTVDPPRARPQPRAVPQRRAAPAPAAPRTAAPVVRERPAPVARAPRRPVRVARPAPRPAPAPAPSIAPTQAPAQPTLYPTPPTAALGTPPAPYAGGQVASGAGVGLLGNRGFIDTPFSQTSYTEKLIQDQQARTIRQVLENDPSTRVVTAPGTGIDAYFIRGFYTDGGDVALNGLYGIAPLYSTNANFIERVEVLKGPSVLLNGAPPAGSVGGSINLITKKAPDWDITQLTASFISRGTFGIHADIARRYGEHKEWGIRFNGSYRGGATPFDRQKEEFANAVLGIDYRGENIRVSADIGHQGSDLKPPIRFIAPLPGALPDFLPFIPRPPAAGTNYMVPWAKWTPTDTFALIKGEVDVTDWLTAYGGFGYRKSEVNFIYPSPALFSTNGNYTSLPFRGDDRIDNLNGEAGLRARFDTGFISHSLSLNFSALDQHNPRSYYAGTRIFSNIYNPVYVPPQIPSRLLGPERINTRLTSFGVADTLSMLDNAVQFTVGARQQTAKTNAYNYASQDYTNTGDTVWSPAYALVVKPVENVSLYANYIEGLQAGEVVGAGFSNTGTVFPAYVAKQKEAGIKFDTGRFGTTLAFFEITRPNSTIVPDALQPSLSRNGEQRNRGAELSVFGEVMPGVRLLGGIALIEGVLTKTADFATLGKTAPGVPKVNVNVGTEIDIPYVDGLTFTGRVIRTSEQFVNDTNTLRLPEWTRVDLGVRYAFTSPSNGKPIVIRAAVENVANLNYWASAYNGVITAGAPRTYLVSTTFNF